MSDRARRYQYPERLNDALLKLADAERRLRELERPGYVWVPEEQLRKYELLLELAGVTGVEARHPDGTRTPNSQLCRDASDEIGAMLAASGEGR